MAPQLAPAASAADVQEKAESAPQLAPAASAAEVQEAAQKAQKAPQLAPTAPGSEQLLAAIARPVMAPHSSCVSPEKASTSVAAMAEAGFDFLDSGKRDFGDAFSEVAGLGLGYSSTSRGSRRAVAANRWVVLC